MSEVIIEQAQTEDVGDEAVHGTAQIQAEAMWEAYSPLCPDGESLRWLEGRVKSKTTPEVLDGHIKMIEKSQNDPEKHYYRVARIGEKVVGFAAGRKKVNDEEPVVEFDYLFVNPERQGEGAGTGLLDDFMGWAARTPELPVGLWAMVGGGADEFYRQAGFEEVGEPIPYREGAPESLKRIRMVRKANE